MPIWLAPASTRGGEGGRGNGGRPAKGARRGARRAVRLEGYGSAWFRAPVEGRAGNKKKNSTFGKPAHAVPFGKRPPEPRKPKGKPGRPFVGARGGGSVGVRNRTGFTARFVPVGRTSTEPNKAEGAREKAPRYFRAGSHKATTGGQPGGLARTSASEGRAPRARPRAQVALCYSGVKRLLKRATKRKEEDHGKRNGRAR